MIHSLRIFAGTATLLLFSIFSTYGFAFTGVINSLEMQSEDQRIVRWNMSADKVSSDNDNEILEATGNVHLYRGDEYLKADFARYYASTNWVYLSGNVTVKVGRDTLVAEEAEFDLRSRVGWLKQGKIFISGPHAYISGERIEKHWGDVYTFKQSKITTCDGDSPAWSIVADEATLEIDGYAHMKGSSFQVKDTPVAFMPYFLFPAKTSRQTGLLKPEYGRSSVKGTYYNQPFFWAINDSSDLTLNLEFMDKRGFKPGIEYRTRPSETTTGWIRFDWMHDKVTNHSDTTGKYTGDGLIRTNDERWWLRGMFDSKLEGTGWRFKADIDLVSDQYFLSEIKSELSGFDRSRGNLFDIFRRDLQEKSKDRKSGALLTHEWERGSINLATHYTQNPTIGHGNASPHTDASVQQLPVADAFLYKGRIFPAIPLEADASLQAGYMYRRNGTRGARYTITPRLTLPLTSEIGSIITSGGVSQTYYTIENPSRSNAPNVQDSQRQRREDRTVPFFDIAAATEFARVYDMKKTPLPLTNSSIGTLQLGALRHSIQPRVEYRYRPLIDQRDNPFYDRTDRLTPTTEIVYSITNVLTRRDDTVVLQKNDAGEMVPTPQTNYIDLLRLRLEQSYDHREAGRDSMRETYERRPFGDVIAELELNATKHLSFSTKNEWSPYLSEFTRHQSSTTVKFNQYGQVYLGYDYRRKLDEFTRKRNEDLRYVTAGGTLNLGAFSLDTKVSYDYITENNHEVDLSLTYNSQCFSITGGVSIDPREENYQLMLTLTGLGE